MREHDYAAQERADRRLECLKLAQAAESRDYQGHPQSALSSRVLERAKEYADFVNGPAAEATDGPAPADAKGMPTRLNDPAAPIGIPGE